MSGSKVDLNWHNPIWYGNTALIMAASNGHAETTMLLVDGKADLNAYNTGGDTALIKAAYNGHMTSSKVLINAKCNINQLNNYGYSALLEAARWGYKNLAKNLVEAKADIRSLLHHNYYDIYKELTDNGVTEVLEHDDQLKPPSTDNENNISKLLIQKQINYIQSNIKGKLYQIKHYTHEKKLINNNNKKNVVTTTTTSNNKYVSNFKYIQSFNDSNLLGTFHLNNMIHDHIIINIAIIQVASTLKSISKLCSNMIGKPKLRSSRKKHKKYYLSDESDESDDSFLFE